MKDLTYILITPARNEEENLANLIECVAKQTLRPLKWVIVSDNSTDRTEEIAAAYCEKYDFIELLVLGGERGRSFASKAGAVKAAYARLKDLEFLVVACLDADMEFGADCFEILMGKIEADDRLGRVGPALIQHANKKEKPQLLARDWHVAGGVELFRRECYEQMDGHRRLSQGGTDTVADIMARMHGWKVRTFSEVQAIHHGEVGKIGGSMFRGRFQYGVQDYSLGYHPLFFLAKMVRRIFHRPYLLGSVQHCLGYFSASLRRMDYAVDNDVVEFLRDEQKARLVMALKHMFHPVEGRPVSKGCR